MPHLLGQEWLEKERKGGREGGRGGRGEGERILTSIIQTGQMENNAVEVIVNNTTTSARVHHARVGLVTS